jgi:hypothetical protein
MTDIPMKANLKEQFNLKIEPSLKDDLKELAGLGVDVPEWIRGIIRDAVKNAKAHRSERQVG